MYMKLYMWGDNINQTLKFFAFSIFQVLAYEPNFDSSLRQLKSS